MQGKIVKGISGFYYIHVVGAGIYECKAKGSFRNQKINFHVIFPVFFITAGIKIKLMAICS